MIEIPWQDLGEDKVLNGVKFTFDYYGRKNDIPLLLKRLSEPKLVSKQPQVYMISPVRINPVFGECVNILAASGSE